MPVPRVEETIFDSGAARNLVRQSIAAEFPEYIKTADQVIHLTTAAGPGECNEVFDYINEDADEDLVALVLPDTPAVMAMGIAVIDMGWHLVELQT